MAETIDHSPTLTPAEATAQLAALAAQYHGAPLPADAPITTATEASAQLAALMANREWGTKYLAGDVAAREQFDKLTTTQAAGEGRLDALLAGKAVIPLIETVADGELPTRDMLSAIEGMRSIGLVDGHVKELMEGTPITAATRRAAEAWRADHFSNKEWTAKLLAGSTLERRELALVSIVLNAPVVG